MKLSQIGVVNLSFLLLLLLFLPFRERPFPFLNSQTWHFPLLTTHSSCFFSMAAPYSPSDYRLCIKPTKVKIRKFRNTNKHLAVLRPSSVAIETSLKKKVRRVGVSLVTLPDILVLRSPSNFVTETTLNFFL